MTMPSVVEESTCARWWFVGIVGCVGDKFNTRAEFESTPRKALGGPGMPDGFNA